MHKKRRTEKHLKMYSATKMTLSRLSGTTNQNILLFLAPNTCRNRISKSEYTHIGNCVDRRNFSGSFVNTAERKDDKHDSDSDTDDHIRPALDSVIPSLPTPTHVDIVPGKGPPPEPPVDCCMSGCANCVWIQYAEELKQYYSLEKGNEKAKEAIEQIENPGLQMFLKLELGLL